MNMIKKFASHVFVYSKSSQVKSRQVTQWWHFKTYNMYKKVCIESRVIDLQNNCSTKIIGIVLNVLKLVYKLNYVSFTIALQRGRAFELTYTTQIMKIVC